jgi:hypothetical protein
MGVFEDDWWKWVMENPDNKMKDSYGVVRIPDKVFKASPIGDAGPLIVGGIILKECRYSIPPNVAKLGKYISLLEVPVTDKGL